MTTTYIVTPGKEDPVEVVSFTKLPSGNFHVVLRCNFREYGRIVTRKGLAAIKREAVAVLVMSEREVA